MSVWLTQFIQFIASDTGSLTYRLVLAFSIVAALFLSLSIDAPVAGYSPRRRRTLLGLTLLLVIQMALFVISAFTWQGLLDGRAILPPLDRSASLLSLVVIVWLWCFPDPNPLGDSGSLLPALMILVASVLATLWWAGQPPQINFNGTLWDIVASIFGMALALLGVLFLLGRRLGGYPYGLAMLAVVGGGLGAHLALLPYGDDFPSIFRVAQMIAYPLLGVLALRIPLEALAAAPGATPAAPTEAAAPVLSLYADPVIWQTLARLAGESDPERTARDIGVTLTAVFDADVCALLAAPNPEGAYPVRLAYDRLRRRLIEAAPLPGRALPNIVSAWRTGRPRRLTANTSTPDLPALAAALDLAQVSSLLFQPVLTGDGKPGAAILLLSLNPAKDWRTAEQEFLAQLARPLVQFLQRSREMAILKEDLTQARTQARIAQDSHQLALDEKGKLQGRLAVLTENAERDRQQITELAAIAAAHSEAQNILAQLHAENETLSAAAQEAAKALDEQRQTRDGELRLALQEIALLQVAVTEAEDRITALKIDPSGDPAAARRPFEIVTAIGSDLRGPLASIGGYADVLLGESMGILGDKQRRYVERIKVSTERMSRMLDELLQAAAPESVAGRFEFEPIDLGEIVRRAVAESEPRLHRRRTVVQLDLPAAPLRLNSDRHALRKITGRLLENAALAAPEGGAVTIHARLETGENDQNYALLQVSDRGGGIAPVDILRVFSPQSQLVEVGAGEATAALPGLGLPPHELAAVKALVEAIGGRIWVDSEPERGAAFSVLFPAAAESAGRNGRTEGA